MQGSFSQIDEFVVEAVDLKELEKIRIGHDGKGSADGWYLGKVVIKDPRDNLKEFIFPCDRYTTIFVNINSHSLLCSTKLTLSANV